MAKYIQWYLVEQELASSHLSRSELHSLLSESEAHLTELSEEFQGQGMSLEDAEKAALERFGPVTPRPATAKESSRSAEKIAVGAFICLGLAEIYFMTAPGFRGIFQAQINLMWSLAAVFLVAIVFVRRVLWRQLGFASLGLVLIGGLVSANVFIGADMDRRSNYDKFMSGRRQRAVFNEQQLERLQRSLVRLSVESKGKPFKEIILPTSWSSIEVQSEYPSGVPFYSLSVNYTRAKSAEEVLFVLNKRGPSIVNEFERILGEEKRWLRSFDVNRGSPPLAAFFECLPMAGSLCAAFLAGALAINVLVTGVSSFGSRRTRKRGRVLA